MEKRFEAKFRLGDEVYYIDQVILKYVIPCSIKHIKRSHCPVCDNTDEIWQKKVFPLTVYKGVIKDCIVKRYSLYYAKPVLVYKLGIIFNIHHLKLSARESFLENDIFNTREEANSKLTKYNEKEIQIQ